MGCCEDVVREGSASDEVGRARHGVAVSRACVSRATTYFWHVFVDLEIQSILARVAKLN